MSAETSFPAFPASRYFDTTHRRCAQPIRKLAGPTVFTIVYIGALIWFSAADVYHRAFFTHEPLTYAAYNGIRVLYLVYLTAALAGLGRLVAGRLPDRLDLSWLERILLLFFAGAAGAYITLYLAGLASLYYKWPIAAITAFFVFWSYPELARVARSARRWLRRVADSSPLLDRLALFIPSLGLVSTLVFYCWRGA